MLTTVIIDDEKLSREVISNYVEKYCKDVEIVATASSVKTAYKAISKFKPDFIFLDIEMADGKGFDLLKMFDKIDFRIIFITAYSEYAVRAFRYSAVDYLLKPVRIDELISAVEKVKSLSGTYHESEYIAALLRNLGTIPLLPQTLVIPSLKGFDVIKIPEIVMCQADGYCTNIFTTGDRKFVSSKNLKHFEDILKDHNIIRVHHSYLINVTQVESYSRQGEINLSEGHKAYLGDSYKNLFIKRFGSK
jgi:two-component system LytT family response regulator